MNNKILARIVATLVAVMMLGTVSFATYNIDVAGDANASTDATKTVLAYVATSADDREFTDSEIVAIAQADTITTVPVDKSKLVGYDYLIVKYGGSANYSNQTAISLKGGALPAFLTVAREVKVGGNTYTNVAYAEFTTTSPIATPVTYSVTFDSYADADATTPRNDGTGITVSSATEFVGGGEVKFGAIILGVGETQGVIRAVPTATPVN